MKVGSLFSGIGGFDLGLERAGMEIVWQVENNPFCNKVLEKHWPNVKRYGDIKNVTNPEPVDLICGGFPCQPYSCAGKRLGAEDDRALWPEMLRVIQEARPRWVIGENVAGFINMGLDQSISDLEREGYTVQAFIIPACAVNAPHRRDRVWIVANRADTGLKILRQERENTVLQTANDRPTSQNPIGGRNGGRDNGDQAGMQCSLQAERSDCNVAYAEKPECEQSGRERQTAYKSASQCDNVWDEPWIEAATRLCRVDDGISGIVDRVARLKALGNAVVPQIVEIIGRAIMEIENA